jgi:hypothetical protein
MTPPRLIAAAVLLAIGCAAPLAHAAQDTAFNEAVKEYRLGRWSTAYGRFFRLANEGDADAARIVLFMYTHGALLYGTLWDANTEDIELWTRLAAERRPRPPGEVLAGAAAMPQNTRTAYQPRITRFNPRPQQIVVLAR